MQRKGTTRDEAIPQVKAQKLEHPKHSAKFSKKRNERFSIQGLSTPPAKPQK